MAEQQRKQRNTAMKWLKLDKDKDPEFDKTYFLTKTNDKGNHLYATGRLKEKTTDNSGTVFRWEVDGVESEMLIYDFSHYAEPKPPVD